MRSDPTGQPPQLVWPQGVVTPARPPILVYLDINHWIGLAKASKGHRDNARYLGLLDAARSAHKRGVALFPLSDTHVIENNNIADPRQRADIAAIMEELSNFQVLASRPVVMRLELDAAIESLIGPGPRYGPVDLLGTGIVRAFGRTGGFKIRDAAGRDVSVEVRQQLGSAEFDAMIASAERDLDRHLLAGPLDSELQDLRRHGYAPEKVREVAENRTAFERDLSVFLNKEPRWRRGRLRDVIAGRELAHEYFDMITELLRPRGLGLPDLINGGDDGDERARIRRFARCMPGAEVAIELKTSYHRDPNKKWLVNDVHDIDALALAVPYCDVVFTDAAARNALMVAKIGERMKTLLPRHPGELTTLLESLQ